MTKLVQENIVCKQNNGLSVLIWKYVIVLSFCVGGDEQYAIA